MSTKEPNPDNTGSDASSGLIERFAETLPSNESRVADHMRAYGRWRSQSLAGDFRPKPGDEVWIRTYLMNLKFEGGDRDVVTRHVGSIKRFYDWAKAEGLLRESPFERADFEGPFLDKKRANVREVEVSADPTRRELGRLRALNHIGERLNRSVDAKSLLDGALEALVEAMGLKTAWVYLHADPEIDISRGDRADFGGYVLGGCCGLPPALESEGRRHLCDPQHCACQIMLEGGRLLRGINIVSCTRLQAAARDEGATEGLRFHSTVPLASMGRILGVINVATKDWELLTGPDLHLLSAAASLITCALERARLFDDVERRRARLEIELEMARVVQASLMPNKVPEMRGLSIAVDWKAAKAMAGDFYDFIPLPGGRLGIVIADVCDKGAPAALYMALSRSVIRFEAAKGRSPAQTLAQVNKTLFAETRSHMFVSVIYAIVEPGGKSLTYCVAGHEPPLLKRKGYVQRQEYGGLLLGIFEDVDLQDRSLELEENDAVILFTDGITDAENPSMDPYGERRLMDAVSTAPSSADGMVSYLLKDLAEFTEDASQPDDMTVLAIVCD